MDIIRANYEMTAEECDLYVKLFQKAESDQRFYLLKIREEKGWKAKRFESFEAFGKAILGIEKTQLYSLAKAGEVQLSLSDSANCGKLIPESHLRPLAPLSADERRQVWEEATAEAEAENKKLTAKLIQETVDRLNAEKSELQSKLDLTEQRNQESQQEANERLRMIKEKDQLLQTAQSESATLRRTLAQEAEKIASAKVLELNQKIDLLHIDKSELKDKLKQLRKDQDATVEARTKQALQAQQDEINRREAQLRSIEGRIEVLTTHMIKVDQQDRVVMHFESAIKKLKTSMNALSLDLMDAFDPEAAAFLPSIFQKDMERLACELEQGAAGIRRLIEQTEVRHLEVLVNE